MWLGASAVAVMLWAASKLMPVVVVASLDGRPYSFFETIYALWAFSAAVLSFQVWVLLNLGPRLGVVLAATLSFVVWFGGGFVT
jgi:hypothetical protein